MLFPIFISGIIILVETLLRYFLCREKFPLKENKIRRVLSVFGLFLFFFFFQFITLSIYISRAIVALVDISFVFTISKGRKINRFLIGFLPSILMIIAEVLSVLLIKLLFSDRYITFFIDTEPGNLIMGGIYIGIDILLLIGVIQLIRRSRNTHYFSGVFIGLVPVLLAIVFFAVDKITDFLLIMDGDTTIHMIENDLLYILFSLLGIILTFGLLFNLQGIINKKEKESSELAQRAKLELDSFKERHSAVKLYRALKHDRKEHLHAIKRLVANKAYDELDGFINQLVDASTEYEIISLTDNVILDNLLSSKIKDAEQQGIVFKKDIQFRGEYGLNDVELCSVFGNAMNNAIEACERIGGQSEKEIFLGVFSHKNMIRILVENTSDGKYSLSSDQAFLTSKIGLDHGIGLERIKNIIEDAGGFVETIASDSRFLLKILLPKAREEEK